MQQRPPKIEGLCPLIYVFDMPRSLGFYRDVLGLEMVRQSPGGDDCDWAWLRLGTAELMLNTMYEAGTRPAHLNKARVAAHRDTAFYLGAPDLDGMYAYLLGYGIDLAEPVVRGYGMRQLSMRDPDGYTICFQWPVA